MVVTCLIEFDQNLSGTYFAGQLVSGSIILKCDKPKEVNAVLLKVMGQAQSIWTERQVIGHRVYNGREDYLSSNTYLIGSENSNKTTISHGVHTYTFACQLPSHCPSSFEGRHGHIRYLIKIILVRPWKFDQTYKRAFTVLKPTDLNFESPHVRIPSSSVAYRTFCCGPCTTEPLKLELKLPQSGYVPGQNIPVEALIINNTNIAVSEVQFSLIMLIRYISENPANTILQRLSVSKIKSDGVLRNCTRSLREMLHVPATPPTCIQSCRVIKISYHIEMEVKMKSWKRSQVVTMPVIIGNVPLANNTVGMSTIQEQPTSENRVRPTDLNIGKSMEPEFDLNMPNIPPPSYEESVHMVRGDINEGEHHSLGPSPFAPLYPVFDVPSPTLDGEAQKALGFGNPTFVPE